VTKADAEYVSRAEQARRTRETIVETALELFSERGYDGTSLQQIADAVGLTKAAVYYHFKTKAEIASAIVLPTHEAIEQLIDRASEGRTRTERIDLMVAGMVDLLLAHRGRMSIVQADPALEVELHKDMTGFDALMDRAVGVLYGQEPTIEERAAVYIAAGLGKSLQRLADAPDDELREALVRTCTRLLRVR